MKGIIRLLLLVVALTTFCGTISAQTGKQRLTREQLAEVQAKHIAKEMAMDDATSQRFIDTFCQFSAGQAYCQGNGDGRCDKPTLH